MAGQADRFLPKNFYEFIGFAALPGEFQQWRDAFVWSIPRFCLWIPVAFGLSIIIWGNWEWLATKIRNRIVRTVLAVIALPVSYIIPGLSGSNQQISSPTTVLSGSQTGTGAGFGGVGINNGSTINNFYPPLSPTAQSTASRPQSDCPPGSAICISDSDDVKIENNTCDNDRHCIVSNRDKNVTITDTKSLNSKSN